MIPAHNKFQCNGNKDTKHLQRYYIKFKKSDYKVPELVFLTAYRNELEGGENFNSKRSYISNLNIYLLPVIYSRISFSCNLTKH